MVPMSKGLGTEQVAELLVDVAAEVVRPRWRNLSDDQVHTKSSRTDLVTVADREAEVLITEVLERAYPDALLVGEEAVAADASVLADISTAERVFVIDPVDGTRNFVNGSPDYAVMVAETLAQETVRAWIWQPEHQRMFIAERGAGARCNGEPLPPLTPGTDDLVGAVTARRLLDPDRVPGLRWPIPMTNFACGIDYPELASGRIDYAAYNGVHPWDHLPGTLLVTEVGGVAKHLNGTRYRVDTTGGPILTAASEEAWQIARRAFH